MGEAARIIAVTDIAALFLAVIAVWALHDDLYARLSRPARWVGGSVLTFLAAVAVAVIINVLSDQAQTDGVKALVWVATPCAVVAVGGVIVLLTRPAPTERERMEAAVIRNAGPLAAMFTHLPHAEPCADPYCTTFRAGVLDLVGTD